MLRLMLAMAPCVWTGAAPSDTLRTRKRLEVERARAVVGELAKQLQLRPTEWAFDGGHMLLTTISLRREKTALDVTLGRAGFQVCVNVQAGCRRAVCQGHLQIWCWFNAACMPEVG